MEFMRRKIKKGKEGFRPCARRITKESKASLRNRIEQINLYNSNLPQNKFRNYTCFYCMQEGHIKNSCPTKRRDESLYAKAGIITFRDRDEAIRARIRKNKETVKCFKCHELGHFADACSQKDAKTMQKQEREEIAATPPLPEPKGKNINIDKLREQHNTYLENYFDTLDRSANIQREIERPCEKEDSETEIGNFQECFEGNFEGLAEILGLKRSDGMDIRRCYLDYLEPLVSNYKAARSSNPTEGYGDEGIRRFDGYHGVAAKFHEVEKGKARKDKGLGLKANNAQASVLDGPKSYNVGTNGYQQMFQSRNTVMAVELIGLLLQNKVTSRIRSFLARRNMSELIALNTS
nr:ARID DNA-binding domain-containing protein [Tanacetum cinerariifolium]